MTHLWGIRGTYSLVVLWFEQFGRSYRDCRRIYRIGRVRTVRIAFLDACDGVRMGYQMRRAHGTPEDV